MRRSNRRSTNVFAFVDNRLVDYMMMYFFLFFLFLLIELSLFFKVVRSLFLFFFVVSFFASSLFLFLILTSAFVAISFATFFMFFVYMVYMSVVYLFLFCVFKLYFLLMINCSMLLNLCVVAFIVGVSSFFVVRSSNDGSRCIVFSMFMCLLFVVNIVVVFFVLFCMC